jgi:MFS family permease
MILPRRLRYIPLAVLFADTLLLALGVGSQLEDAGVSAGLAFTALIVALVIGLVVIGRLIVERDPGNAVGWIFIACSVGMGVATTCCAWASLSHDRFGNGLPATVFAAWVNSWIGIPSLVSLVLFVPLLFPNGHLLSARWRWVAIAAAVGVTATTIGSALVPGLLDPIAVQNPVGVPLPDPVKGVLGLVDSLSGLVIFALAVAAVVLRYRRGSSTERLQLRWFAFPATVAIIALGTSALLTLGVVSDIAWIVGLVALTTLPIAIGIAILRYHLYEIDVLLNRTAVCAAVTAILRARGPYRGARHGRCGRGRGADLGRDARCHRGRRRLPARSRPARAQGRARQLAAVRS